MPTEDPSPAASSRMEEFDKYFDLSLALTRKQRALVYEIRYRVYCEEFGYEPVSAVGNRQEVDEFDCQSIHCLVTHKVSGMPAGCVRVVMVEGSDSMPMEVHAAGSIDRTFTEAFQDRRETVCEVSRLAVDTSFRRRHRDWESRFGKLDPHLFTSTEARSFPLIAMALMLGAGAVADVLGRTNCFAIMEPALAVMMKRAGISFRRIGTDFEFRGTRAPYYGNMNELIGTARADFRAYYEVLRDRFVPVLRPEPPAEGRSAVSVKRCNSSAWTQHLPGGRHDNPRILCPFQPLLCWESGV